MTPRTSRPGRRATQMLLAAGLAATLFAPRVQAQEDNWRPADPGKFDGDWALSRTPNPFGAGIKLSIRGAAATFPVLYRGKEGNPCLRREWPATVQVNDAGTRLRLHIARKETMSFCEDAVWTFDVAPDGRLTRTDDGGRTITAVR